MSSAITHYADTKNPKSMLQTVAVYRPFLLGLLIVLLATATVLVLRSNLIAVDTYQIMNSFMGCFFIVFALPKFFNLAAFAKTFQKYDFISKRVPVYARLFPFIELCLGLLLISSLPSNSMLAGRIINVIVAVMSGLGVVSVMRALRQNKQLDCACMGTAFTFPLSKVTVAENGVMFVMAMAMLVVMRPDHMVMATVINFSAALL